MSTSRPRQRAALFLLIAGMAEASARAQFAGLLNTNARYAGNSTGTNLYNGDAGAANAISLNAPSYSVFDSLGNLYVSDTANNCVRKIGVTGNVSTVAGLRVNGGGDTCNTLINPAPSAAQGLLRPTGLVIGSGDILYIADSQHNCVRSLASGAVDSFAANALTTVAGTCNSLDTGSVTPVPNGLATDSSGNLYIAIQDASAAIPVNQVLRHRLADPATTVCYIAGAPSANVPSACAGITGSVALSSPAGLAFDVNGNLFVADTGNNCVREVVGLTTLQTAVGQCTSTAGALNSPYGLAFSPAGALYISESGASANNVVSFAPGTGAVTPIAGLPTGAPGAYSSQMDGQSSLSAPLHGPLGLTTDSNGNIYLADSLNNVVREMSTGLRFQTYSLGTTSATQIVTFAINQAVNLTASAGSDYSIVSTSCTGVLVASAPASPPSTCQALVAFTPTLPGGRSSALQLSDSISGSIISVGLRGTGQGSLSLLTPGSAASLLTNLRSPVAVSVDSAGNAYVLNQGNGTSPAQILSIPAGGGAPHTVVAQGVGLQTPTAMAIDGAGNIFVTDADYGGVVRVGADGSVNTSYVNGIVDATAIAVDDFDNLYIAQGDVAHNVIEVLASGTRRIIAGSGTTSGANGVAATNALFLAPSALALGPNGLSIADASGHFVYTVDGAGTIHLVAGNGSTVTTAAGLALGTALLLPVGLAADAAGDLYIADEAANRVYEVYPTSSAGVNIGSPLGTGASGYAGDGGPAPLATLNSPVALALDGSSNLFAIDSGNSSMREVTYPVTANINFGHIVIGTTSKVIQQTFSNAGNAALALTTPFTTTDLHFAASTSAPSTTCSSSLQPGAVCELGFTFTPTVVGTITAQSNVASNSYNAPQIMQMTATGIIPQSLPYTLVPETEVYGQPFTETATITIVYPNLVPTGTMVYAIAGETTCGIGGPFPVPTNCPATESGLGVGTYQVNFTYNSGDLDYFSTAGTTTLTVTPGSLSVTPTNETKAYGAPIPALPSTLIGVVNGDLFLSSQTTTATVSSPPGTYPITSTLTPVGLASLNNYTVTYNTGTLTITPMPLTVTVGNATRAYGTPNPVFTSTIAGAVNGDTFTITYSTPAAQSSQGGAYPITAIVSGPAAANYAITVIPGTLTITQAVLTVRVGNATRMYGTPNPVFTGTLSGAANGDTFTNTYSTAATNASPVGGYAINDVVGGPAAANYIINVIPGTLTITQGSTALNVMPNSATRAYGAANPVFTSTITGALNGDTFTVTFATVATPASPTGTYAIVPTVSGAALGNYATVTTSNGTLTVTPAPLTVSANNAARMYGAANPPFTSTITGLLNGDSIAITYTTPATASSPIGNYPIAPAALGSPSSNYTVTFSSGVLAVTAATSPLTVTVNSATRVYGSANPIFTGTTTGLLNGDTVTVTYATTAIPASNPGNYPITATVTGAAIANYTLNIVPGVLAITPAATSTALTTSASPVVSGNSITFTATVISAAGMPGGMVTFFNGNLPLGTGILNASGVATFTTSALAPGSYSIVANYAGSTNFGPSTGTVAQIVSPGTFTLSAGPQNQFVRGPGTTLYTVSLVSAQNFSGPIALSCVGLPSDASCTFASPSVPLAAGGTASTTMTVVNTSADAKLQLPGTHPGFPPFTLAAILPFEFTGVSVFLAGLFRRRKPPAPACIRSRRTQNGLLLALLGTVALVSLTGCACFTSTYKNYTITVTGTSTTLGVQAQSASVVLTVAQQ